MHFDRRIVGDKRDERHHGCGAEAYRRQQRNLFDVYERTLTRSPQKDCNDARPGQNASAGNGQGGRR